MQNSASNEKYCRGEGVGAGDAGKGLSCSNCAPAEGNFLQRRMPETRGYSFSPIARAEDGPGWAVWAV
jgi:hypothetical protein